MEHRCGRAQEDKMDEVYDISEAARLFGITPGGVRYYESLGLIRPARSESGRRKYSVTDLQSLMFLRSVRARGLSPEEIRHLDVFCRERFIELVPNQNALGHMAPWLAREEYASLAECEEGFSYGGFTLPATTLDPEDERSLALVMQMADDLLSNVSSKRIHMGLDEPFELGFGKSRGKALGPVFCRYVSRLHGELAARGRQMMMWSDALHRFGATELDLPEDILFLEWGYEKEHPFGERCGRLKEAGKRFYVCPGTSSWNTFTGMTDNMLLNIDHAISAAKSFGAEGVLLTDWGDGNHMQQLPFSYGPVVYCGIRAWNPDVEISREKLGHLLDAYIFMDRAG